MHFGRPIGSEPGYRRPTVVVQSNLFNDSGLDTVVVCATTTAAHRADDVGNVELDQGDGDLPEDSVVNVTQIIAVDESRLVEWIGALDEEKLRRVMGGIRQVLEAEDLGF